MGWRSPVPVYIIYYRQQLLHMQVEVSGYRYVNCVFAVWHRLGCQQTVLVTGWLHPLSPSQLLILQFLSGLVQFLSGLVDLEHSLLPHMYKHRLALTLYSV